MKRSKPTTDNDIKKPVTRVKTTARDKNIKGRSQSKDKKPVTAKAGKKSSSRRKIELSASDGQSSDDVVDHRASRPLADSDEESIFESEDNGESDDLDEMFSEDEKPKSKSRKASRNPSRGASKKPAARAKSRGNTMDEEKKPANKKSKAPPERLLKTPKSKKPKDRNSSSNKAVHKQLFKEEDNRSLKEMTGFFFSYLRDKNAKGMTINSLVKYMKTNSIQNKDRKLEIDDELALRMIRYLVKSSELNKKGVKPEDLYIEEGELEEFVGFQRKFHLGMMKRILDK